MVPPAAPSAPPPGGHRPRPGSAGSAALAWERRARSTGLRRRQLLQLASALSLFGAARSFAGASALLGGTPRPTALVTLDVPDIAENGAVVPITVTSALPGTREIVLLVENNPEPLALRVTLPDGTEPFVAARIRMASSGTVMAAVRTDDGLYAASRAVEVIVGGCG